jgi:hypothetical protein
MHKHSDPNIIKRIANIKEMSTSNIIETIPLRNIFSYPP